MVTIVAAAASRKRTAPIAAKKRKTTTRPPQIATAAAAAVRMKRVRSSARRSRRRLSGIRRRSSKTGGSADILAPMLVPRLGRGPPDAGQLRVIEHRLDQPLAQPAPAVRLEHEQVGQPPERRPVGHRAGE